ncbi:hypothetical protein [Streptomyces sioyaensis]|uniref:hypothetical protein n=1 Tax=Streptomyces sioyaensis TaxID=67364 RepID=UPI00379D7911
MDAETLSALGSLASAVAAIAAAVISIVSAFYTRRAANAAASQTELQREIVREAAAPYVWVDVRADEAQGAAFNLILGNSGPTFAHNVRAKIEPPLPNAGVPSSKAVVAQRRLRDGIKSLGPGHKLVWFIGIGHQIVKDDAPQLHTITVEADGPHGPLAPMTYESDLADFRETRDAPEGNLHFVRKAIEKIEKRLPNPDRPVRVLVENQDGE